MATAPNRSRFRTSRFSSAQPTYSTTGNLPTPVQTSIVSSDQSASPIGSIFANRDESGSDTGESPGGDSVGGGSSSSPGGGWSHSGNAFGPGGWSGISNESFYGALGVVGPMALGVPGLSVVAGPVGRSYGRSLDQEQQFMNDEYGKLSKGLDMTKDFTTRNYDPPEVIAARSGQSDSDYNDNKGPVSQGNALGDPVSVSQNPDGSYTMSGGNNGDNSYSQGASPDSGYTGSADQDSSDAMSAFAKGGRIVGAGGPTDDEVPIKASNGEYMLSDAQLSAMAQELFGTPDTEMMRDYLDQFSMNEAGQTPNNAGGEDGFPDGSMQHKGMEYSEYEAGEGDQEGGMSALRDINAGPQSEGMPEGMQELDETQQKIAQSLPMSATPQELGLLSRSLTPEVIKILGKALGPNMAYMLQPVANVGASMKSVNRPMITDTADRMGGIAGPLPPMGNEALRSISAR